MANEISGYTSDLRRLAAELHDNAGCASDTDDTAREMHHAADVIDSVISWLRNWVDTGEDRWNDDEDDHPNPRWETYAGWLDVGEMPSFVRSMLDPDRTRWRGLSDNAQSVGGCE